MKRILLGAGLVVGICVVAASSCSDSKSADSPAPSGATTASPSDGGSPSSALTDRVVVAGQLAIDGSSEAPILSQQKVDLTDSSDRVIASGYADSAGKYAIDAGVLAIESGASLTEGQYKVSSIIDDDAGGKVLGIRQNVQIDATTLKNGRVDAGVSAFAEVAAIKGKVRFINPDGTDNPKVARLGVDVYIPGQSFFAKTDRDGAFLILYVPAGAYTLRLEKGVFSKEVSVNLVESKTTLVGEVKVQTDTEAPITQATRDSTDFRSPLCVKLSVSESASSIFFTTDGSTPLASDAFKYPPAATTSCGGEAACPICVANSSMTVKYYAVDAAGNVEDQKSRFYIYNEKWADPSDHTAPITTLTKDSVELVAATARVTAPITVRLSANEDADTYYTIDGADPTVSGILYTEPLVVANTTTIKYYSRDWARNVEAVKTKTIQLYNWHKVTDSAAQTFPASIHGFGTVGAYNSARKHVLVFCPKCDGASGNPLHHQTWTYGVETDAWTLLATWNDAGPEITPNLVRPEHTVIYDAVNDKMYLFWTSSTRVRVRIFNYTNNLWEDPTPNGTNHGWETQNTYVGGAYNPLLNKVWLTSLCHDYGDSHASSRIDHTFFDFAGNTFAASASNPPYTTGAFWQMVWDSTRERMVGFGAFAIPDTPGNPGSSVCKDGSNRVDISNTGATYELYKDSVSDTLPVWHRVVSDNLPTLGASALVYDSDRALTVSFGADVSTASNDVWTYDGVDWTQAMPPVKLKPRTKAIVAYDPINKRTLVIGGTDGYGNQISDVWEYKP